MKLTVAPLATTALVFSETATTPPSTTIVEAKAPPPPPNDGEMIGAELESDRSTPTLFTSYVKGAGHK